MALAAIQGTISRRKFPLYNHLEFQLVTLHNLLPLLLQVVNIPLGAQIPPAQPVRPLPRQPKIHGAAEVRRVHGMLQDVLVHARRRRRVHIAEVHGVATQAAIGVRLGRDLRQPVGRQRRDIEAQGAEARELRADARHVDDRPGAVGRVQQSRQQVLHRQEAADVVGLDRDADLVRPDVL